MKKLRLNAAEIYILLQQPKSALQVLRKLVRNNSSASEIAASRIKQAEILIKLARFSEARDIFPSPENFPPLFAISAQLIQARLYSEEGEDAAAAEIYSRLVKNPKGQSLTQNHEAALGLADTQAAAGDTRLATETIINYLAAHPEAPLLDASFQRILSWLPTEQILETDPTIVQLRTWIPSRPAPKIQPVIGRGLGQVADDPNPPNSASRSLQAYSLYTLAIANDRGATDRQQKQAVLLLDRIRHLFPNHSLAARSILTRAIWKLDDGDLPQANFLLNLLQDTESELLRSQVNFYLGTIRFRQGFYTDSANQFDAAAALMQGENRVAALKNSALARLEQNPSASITIQSLSPEEAPLDPILVATLDLERALLSASPEPAVVLLNGFLANHSTHPRLNEARLALAEASLALDPPNPKAAAKQLRILSEKPMEDLAAIAPRIALTKVRYLSEIGNIEESIHSARALIESFPGTSEASDAAILVGTQLFRSKDYNEARLILENTAMEQAGTQRAQAALFLAARAAALGATSQSREEALVLYDRTIEIEGPLSPLAVLEKARLNISLNQMPEAIASLRKAYQESSPDDPARLNTGLLLAEAIYAQGNSGVSDLNEVLPLYDELLALSKNNLPQTFRLQYLRGLALEKLPDSSLSGDKQIDQALAAYFTILDRPSSPPPPEWEWFYKGSFRALLLLETAERWPAAIALAEKIASFGGPRTEDAQKRARQLRLKHMIWED